MSASNHGVVVAVAAHKPYRMPSDSAYLPIQVGAALHPDVNLGFQRDDEGDNISGRNGTYSELTALYWIWKNVNAPAKGLVHYRRLLGSMDSARQRAAEPLDRVATKQEFEHLLTMSPVVLPKRRHYVIETVEEHYAHTMTCGSSHLAACRRVLEQVSPEVVPAWDDHMRARSAHICNMFVMSADVFDTYCTWLFMVLSELERTVDSDGMSSFDARWPGRVAERLLDPWLVAQGISYQELPVVSPEPVDWVAKGRGFLAAKFLGKKYGESF